MAVIFVIFHVILLLFLLRHDMCRISTTSRKQLTFLVASIHHTLHKHINWFFHSSQLMNILMIVNLFHCNANDTYTINERGYTAIILSFKSYLSTIEHFKYMYNPIAYCLIGLKHSNSSIAINSSVLQLGKFFSCKIIVDHYCCKAIKNSCWQTKIDELVEP